MSHIIIRTLKTICKCIFN